ncbi:hypothetical protein Vretimale_11396 [Volvox reticuliferus]|nr:hypothetical protein Vretimale_11396 [Volvox reticuliferus]
MEVYDYDVAKNDDCLGKAEVDIVSVRCQPGGKIQMEVPLFRRISKRQQGHVLITLSFLSTSSAAAATNVSPDVSTFAAHLHEAEAARSAAVAFAATNRAAMDAAGGDGGSGPAAGLTACAPGSCLASGLVAAGTMPDTVPSYAPTCGLIAPEPGKLLSCHQTSENDRGPAAQAAAAQVGGPPPPGPGPGLPQGGAYATSAEPYPVVNPQSYDIGSTFRAPPGAWAGPGPAGAVAPQVSTPYADSHPIASAPQSQSPYHQLSTHQASSYEPYNPTTAASYPHAAATPYYQQEPSAPPLSYPVPQPTAAYPAPLPLNPVPNFMGSAPYAAYPATAPPYGAPPPALPPGVYYPPPGYA